MMRTGAAKLFNDAKCFGFITLDGVGEDLLKHFFEVQGRGFKPQENQKMSFDVKPGPKGKQAANILSF